MWSEIDDTLADRLKGHEAATARIEEVEPLVADGSLSPASAAQSVLDAFGV
jgi:hypothetical protein